VEHPAITPCQKNKEMVILYGECQCITLFNHNWRRLFSSSISPLGTKSHSPVDYAPMFEEIILTYIRIFTSLEVAAEIN
jgi:hypothetical protein